MSERDDGALPEDVRVDVVLYPSREVKAVPAGKGGDVVRSYRERDDGPDTVRQVLAGLVVAAILAYSLLVVRSFLLGVVAAVLVYLALVFVPRLTGTDADLLDADVTLRDARQQWDAEPVAELTERGRERRREPEHAFE